VQEGIAFQRVTGCIFFIDKDDFIACPDESVDYAVMEQTDAAVVGPLDAGTPIAATN
jgi:mannose-1-phosphate guanylyltransferase